MIQENRKKLLDLIVIYVIALLVPSIQGIYIYITGQSHYDLLDMNYSFIISTIQKLGAILVMWYILHKNNEGISNLGFSFRLKDLFHGILLIVLVYLGSYVLALIIYNVAPSYYNTQPQNIEFLTVKITFWYILFMIINPFYEELIIRAFFIEKIESLSNIRIAVILSVVLQLIPHLYQGIISVLYLGVMFTLFSLYYVKYRRIVPIIFAHMFFDIIGMINYGG